MAVLNHGSLFSGIGGFDLAAEWIGWQNIFHCEKDEFCRKVLDYYWPQSETHTDIYETDFTIYRGKIDILTGGFPCQPFSAAGKRKGTADDRHLWPQMLRAIREIKPSWIIAENVLGLLSIEDGMVFEQVCADLEVEAYKVWPFIIPACAKNAPHRRDRVWIIANSDSVRGGKIRAYTKLSGKGEITDDIRQGGSHEFIANSEGVRNNTSSRNEANKLEGKKSKNKEQARNGRTSDIGRFNDEQPTTNANSNIRCKRRLHTIERKEAKRYFGTCDSRPIGGNWENFPTESPICSGNDGISSRLDGITFPKLRRESIKAYGNAIVPQIAYEIFKAINETIKITQDD